MAFYRSIKKKEGINKFKIKQYILRNKQKKKIAIGNDIIRKNYSDYSQKI